MIQTVQGFHLPLVAQPVQSSIPSQMHFPPKQQSLISMEVEGMLEKQAISVVQPNKDSFISQIFVIPKKDGGYHPVGPEQVHSRRTFQDGGLSHGEESSRAQGLDGKDRLERCLLSRSRTSEPQVPPIRVPGAHLSIPLSTVWSVLCPQDIYKTDETSSGHPEGERHQDDN